MRAKAIRSLHVGWWLVVVALAVLGGLELSSIRKPPDVWWVVVDGDGRAQWSTQEEWFEIFQDQSKPPPPKFEAGAAMIKSQAIKTATPLLAASFAMAIAWFWLRWLITPSPPKP